MTGPAEPPEKSAKGSGPPDFLEEKIAAALEGSVAASETPQIVERIQAAIRQDVYRGPLPRPRDLKAYDLALPGSAERLLRMAEIQQTHNAEVERKIITAQIEDQKRGMQYGLFALVLLIANAAFFGFVGNNLVAGLFLTAGVIGIIPTFIRGRDHRSMG